LAGGGGSTGVIWGKKYKKADETMRETVQVKGRNERKRKIYGKIVSANCGNREI
jgi:hypothetical protein